MTPTKLWLSAAVFFLVVEIMPPPTHFYFLCLVFGSIAAAITTMYTSSLWWSLIVFVVVSVALIPVLVPLAKFLFTPKRHASNVDALVGAKALVLEAVESKTPGSVKIGGEIWSAKSEGESFAKDQWVQVVRVEGSYVFIRRLA